MAFWLRRIFLFADDLLFSIDAVAEAEQDNCNENDVGSVEVRCFIDEKELDESLKEGEHVCWITKIM